MTPTAILITGSYDALADEPGDGTNFINCDREVATHISVYLAEDHEIEPVQDFPLKPDSAKAYADALTLAAGLAHEKTLPIRDTYQNNFFRAPAYPQVEQRYCVDGAVYPNDENGPLFQGDGQYPPFVIFDIQGQKNLPGHYQTRGAAEEALSKLLGLPEQPQPFQTPDCPDCACVQDGQCLCTPSKPSAAPAERAPRVTDAMYHAFVETTRLQGNESETVKDLVMNGLEEAMAVYVPPEPMMVVRKVLISQRAALIKERNDLRALLRRCYQTCDMPPTLYADVEKILPCEDEGCPQSGSEHVCTTITKGAPPKPDLTKYAYDADKHSGYVHPDRFEQMAESKGYDIAKTDEGRYFCKRTRDLRVGWDAARSTW